METQQPISPPVQNSPTPSSHSRKRLMILLLVLSLLFMTIIGLFAYQSTQTPTQVPSPPESPIQPTSVPVEPAEWKIYKNEEFGFKIHYPPDWITELSYVNNDRKYYNFFVRDASRSNYLVWYNKGFNISKTKSPEENADDLAQFSIQYVPGFNYYSPEIVKKSKIYIDNKEAWQHTIRLNKTDGELPYSVVSLIHIIENNTSLLALELHGDNQEILEQILSTFRFLGQEQKDPQQISSAKTYCSQTGGTWLEDFNECEFRTSDDLDTKKVSCINVAGNFDECTSACRHRNANTSSGGGCTTQCIPVCSFK